MKINSGLHRQFDFFGHNVQILGWNLQSTESKRGSIIFQDI
jgi:hypothetical protein